MKDTSTAFTSCDNNLDRSASDVFVGNCPKQQPRTAVVRNAKGEAELPFTLFYCVKRRS